MPSVIFDLDGTLVDSAPDIHAAVNRMLTDEGKAGLSHDEVRGFIGNGVPVLVARILAARGRHGEDGLHDRWQRRFLSHYEAAPAVLTRLYPGVPAALSALSDAGHRIGLCTNKPEGPARQVLQAFGLDGVVSVVIGGDTLAVRKPDPAPLIAAAGALGPGPVLFVGDSEVDAETAVAAGVPFLLFTEGYRKAAVATLPHAAAFDDFASLPGLVEGHFAR